MFFCIFFISIVFVHLDAFNPAILHTWREAAGEERSFGASQLAVVVNGKMSKRQNAKYIFLDYVYWKLLSFFVVDLYPCRYF